VTLRAVARELGMAVSALYRYVDNRDDLLTELLVEAFTAHADAVEDALQQVLGDEPPASPAQVSRAMTGALGAYRAWALAEPERFGLAFGAPLPGYRAPADRTIAAAARPGDLLARLLGQAQAAGFLDSSAVDARAAALDETTADGLRALAARRGYELDLGALALMTDVYTRWHGLVAMEAFGQLRPFVADAEPYAHAVLRACVASLGLPAPSSD
jgi:AcrR family transcriptional regulator